jgi:diacylglycerol kinase (ATP)
VDDHSWAQLISSTTDRAKSFLDDVRRRAIRNHDGNKASQQQHAKQPTDIHSSPVHASELKAHMEDNSNMADGGSESNMLRRQAKPEDETVSERSGAMSPISSQGSLRLGSGALPDAPHGKAAGGTKRSKSWWGSHELQWSNYRIEEVPQGCKPLLVFINTKSGPQMGVILRRKFLRLLNPLQVVELPREPPEPALQLFAAVSNLRILCVGGDGTVGWILNLLDKVQESQPSDWIRPPVAIIPLGTGNDLARVLNWGGGLSGFQQRGLSAVLQDIEQSTLTLLDRWSITIEPRQLHKRAAKKLQRAASLSRKDKKVDKKTMNNYLGIGVDAKAALEFHHLREHYPQWFHSQVGNKLWYTGLGAKEIMQHSTRFLSKRLQIECDGSPLELPPDIEGVLFSNIPSYMGGVNLWASGIPTGSATRGHQSICDGKLEVVGVYGSWHLGQLQVGLSRAIRLAQCSHARITTSEKLPMQVDGEPWNQDPAVLEVSVKNQALMLRRINDQPLARMAHTVAEALDQCECKGIITASQRHAISKELAAKLHPAL